MHGDVCSGGVKAIEHGHPRETLDPAGRRINSLIPEERTGMTQPGKRRLVFCFDGTWNRLNADLPTNVVRIAQMVPTVARDGTPQVVYYNEGVGTGGWLNRFNGGMFGQGMLQIMREAYRFLIFNYRPGDEIYAFGFSRGAYTARSFIGLIRHGGILDVARATAINRAIEIYRRAPAGQTGEESAQAIRFRLLHCQSVCVSERDREARVRLFPALSEAERAGFPEDYDPARLEIIDFRYLGVFETVRALGMPGFVPGAALLNRRYAFHNAVLTSKVAAARHAVAIDELRSNFEPTLFGRDKLDELNALAARDRKQPFAPWQEPYQERWFPGMHNAVGGGGPWRGLADMALAWVLRGARTAGLDLRIEPGSPVYGVMRDPFVSITGSSRFDWLISPRRRPRVGPIQMSELSLPALARWHADPDGLPDRRLYRPPALAHLARQIDAWPHAPAARAASLQPRCRQIRVAKGETLRTIAARELGDPARWQEVFTANRDQLGDPDDVPIGIELRIPPS
jgi:uncharacterized protein (DUF2235 family)